MIHPNLAVMDCFWRWHCCRTPRRRKFDFLIYFLPKLSIMQCSVCNNEIVGLDFQCTIWDNEEKCRCDYLLCIDCYRRDTHCAEHRKLIEIARHVNENLEEFSSN